MYNTTIKARNPNAEFPLIGSTLPATSVNPNTAKNPEVSQTASEHGNSYQKGHTPYSLGGVFNPYLTPSSINQVRWFPNPHQSVNNRGG